MPTEIKPDIVYPELSYKIIGIAFKIFNKYGFGLNEKFYQKIFAKEFENESLPYEKEKFIKIIHDGQVAGNYFLDFVVDKKIVVELKIKARFGYVHIKQVMTYLKLSDYKLAIIIYFTSDGVKYRRIVNIK